jgi:penicillin-binding protein 2
LNRSQPPALRIRLALFRVFLAATFLVLAGQLWRLQMIRGDYYRNAADVNRFRLTRNPAPRGVIYDREGHLLARNQPQIKVAVIPAYLPEDRQQRTAMLIRLADLLQMPAVTVEAQIPGAPGPGVNLNPKPGILDIVHGAERAIDFYRPTLLKAGVSREVAMKLEEEHLDWPGIIVQIEPVREYEYGSLLAHLLGYVGPIPAEQAPVYAAQGYDPNQEKVGLTGVEYIYEQELRGRDGQKLVEVDIAGREVRMVGEPQAVVPGHNLRLTIDLRLQSAVEDILSRHLRIRFKQQAAVVAMNPQTGEILALVSLPAYDNNDFSGGISLETLRALQEDPNRPLVNHAISGMFPPGSTYKIIAAAGGLEEKVIDLGTRLYCGGILWLPNRFYPEDPQFGATFLLLDSPWQLWSTRLPRHHLGSGAIV